MTTIAWDGRILAADKRTVNNWLARTTTKIRRIRDMRCAVSGDLDDGGAMLAWLEAGDPSTGFPDTQRDRDRYCTTVVVIDGALWCYETTPEPFRLEDPFCAFGSGRDFALMAMHLGKTAIEAVELAAVFDLGTGNGVDWLV